MRILEILLEHQPDLGGGELGIHHSRFPTPLHCAANSGWLSHARALVGAGALVYTGPHCSPICWADGGSGGNQPVAVFLREILGEGGLAMIEDDHAELRRKNVKLKTMMSYPSPQTGQIPICSQELEERS